MTNLDTASRFRLFVSVFIFVGIIVGSGVSVWIMSEFFIKSHAFSTAITGITTKISVLEKMREGQYEKATGTLESLLDSDLIGLSILLPEYSSDTQVAIVLNRASDYRIKHPYVSSEPSVNSRISELLSKRK